MELIAESEMKITSVIPIPGGSTLVSEGNVGKYGKVFASHNIYSNSATKNAGNFDGEASANKITIASTGSVKGNLSYKRVTIDDGAILDVNFHKI